MWKVVLDDLKLAVNHMLLLAGGACLVVLIIDCTDRALPIIIMS
jgi:hypothetical protein